MTSPAPAGRERPRLRAIGGEAALDGAWASDYWDASRLGIPARRGRGTARFGGITQPWLREPVKRWSRLRLATGCAFATIDAGALALTRFSRFLAMRHLRAADASAITRPVLHGRRGAVHRASSCQTPDRRSASRMSAASRWT